MLSSIILFVSAVLPLQVEQDTPSVDPAVALTELQAAVDKLAEAAGYTYERSSRDEGGGFGGGGGRRGGGGGGASVTVVGRVARDKPLHLTQGDTVAWRQGDTLIHRQGEAGWQSFEAPAPGGGGFGGRGAGRGGREGGRGGREGGGAGGDWAEFRALRALMALQSETPPHELLADAGAQLADVTREDDDGQVIYTGKLTAAGASAVGGGLLMGRMGRGRGGDVETSGSFRITLNDEGLIESVAFDTVMAGSFGERDFERKRHVDIRLSAVGATELEVPDEVVAALSGETAPEPEETPVSDEDSSRGDEV